VVEDDKSLYIASVQFRFVPRLLLDAWVLVRLQCATNNLTSVSYVEERRPKEANQLHKVDLILLQGWGIMCASMMRSQALIRNTVLLQGLLTDNCYSRVRVG
jgi:hypothetical protein